MQSFENDPSIAPLRIVGVYRIFSYTPTNLNAFRLFRRSCLSLVSLGAPSARYSSVPLLYQSLCDYYKWLDRKVNKILLQNTNQHDLITLDDFREPIGISCVRTQSLQNHLFFIMYVTLI